MKRFSTLLSILATTLSASLAYALISEGGRTTYDLNDGLSNGYVTSMAEDSKGGIWVATESGLNKFDGKRFINLTKENSALPANELNVVVQDPDNPDRLWIATQRDGVKILSLEDMEFKDSPDERLWPMNVVDIKAAPGGGIWLTDYHFGAHYYNEKNGEIRKYNHETVEGLPRTSYASLETQDGTLYVGHVTEGLSAIDTVAHTFTNYRMDNSPIPGDCVYHLMEADNGYVWIGTDNGAALLNPWTKRITPFVSKEGNPKSIAPGGVRRIIELKDGSILFATMRGGTCMATNIDYDNPEKAEFTSVTAEARPGSMECKHIRALVEDRFGNLWIGQYRAGVNVISHVKPMFQREKYVKTTPQGWLYPPVWSCLTDSEGNLWLGSDGEISRLGKEAASFPIPGMNEGQKTAVTAIVEDNKGDFLVGTTDQGAFRFNKTSGTFTQIEGLPVNVRSIYKSPTGSILFATNDYIWQLNGNQAEKLPIESELSDHVVQSIRYDAAGNIWIGTFGKGINIMSPDFKRKAELNDAHGFVSNAINDILKDSKGRMWVATRNGLVLFEKPSDHSGYKLVIDPSESGVSHIMAIDEDKEGNFWASLDNGVAFINGKSLAVTFHHSDREIPLNSFSERGSAVGKDGRVYFASANGIISINTDSTVSENHYLPVVVTGFTAYKEGDNRKENEIQIQAKNGKVVLPYNQSTFRITFAVPDQGIMKYSSFAYKMEGYDDSWVDLRNENSVSFRNLSPGNYKLLVRYRFKGNEWSKPTQVANIIIPPPIWLRWWAITLYVLIFIGIVIFMFYLYVRRVRLKERYQSEIAQNQQQHILNEERLRFFTNITHELRTPLTLIIGPIEDMVSDPTLPAKYNTKLRMIRESSKSLLSLINGILEFRKTETRNRELSVAKGNISNLVYEIGLRFKELNMNKDVEIILDIDKGVKKIYFDRDMISIMLNNILSNAVKYTEKGSIVLSLRQVLKDGEERTEISVADTGYGMSKEELSNIYKRYYQVKGNHQASGTGIGLSLVKNLADLHEADIIAESEEGKGSTFIISLLTENIYPNAIHNESLPQTRLPQPEEGEFAEAAEAAKRCKVLIVEDNDNIREYICQSLESDYSVVSASNGLEGLKAVHEESPDIVVSDIMMPEMDGIQLCTKIKEDILTSHIAVILLTAKDSLSDRETGYESGADSYLTKPFSAKLLRGRISNLLIRKERLAKALVKESKEIATQGEHAQKEQSMEKQTASEPVLRLSPLDRKFMEQINNHVCENLADPELDVQFLADKMCMSYSTLYRKCKSILGISMLEYIRGIRLAKAKEMIQGDEMSISEIAYAVGYGGHSSFGKIFRREFGMSPSEYAAKWRARPAQSDRSNLSDKSDQSDQSDQ